MKKKRGPQELESLIPSVRNTEQHLDALMADARLRAERVVSEAKARAQEAVREARAGLPALLSAERDAEVRRLRQEADNAAGEERARTDALERGARAAMETAVRFVVDHVWPGGLR